MSGAATCARPGDESPAEQGASFSWLAAFICADGMPLYEDLVRRALEVKARSEGLVLDAQRVVDLSMKLRAARAGEVSIVRCAWCGRFKVGEEWLHLEAIGRGQQHIQVTLMERATNGICPDCFDEQVPRRDETKVAGE